MEIRIGDAERERATQRLNDHFAAGRLDHEEFNERLDAIWSARTRADVDQLFLDLPWVTARTAVVTPAKPSIPGRRLIPQVPGILALAVLVTVVMVGGGRFVLLLAVLWFVFLRPRRQPRRQDRRQDRVRRGAS